MKKFVLFLFLCVSAGSIFAQEVDPAQLKKEGNEALSAKNYVVAFDKYSKYLELTNYQDSVTAFNCGVCADNVKKPAEAAKFFGIAIDKNYNLANAYVGKAGALKDLKKNDEYIQTIAEGLKAVPGNVTLEKLYAIYYLKEGQKYQKVNNKAKAEENYKNILSINSKKWKTDALYSLGVLFYNSGAQTLQKATPLATSNPEKYKEQKEAAMADFKKSTDYLEEGLALSPDNANIPKILSQVKNAMK